MYYLTNWTCIANKKNMNELGYWREEELSWRKRELIWREKIAFSTWKVALFERKTLFFKEKQLLLKEKELFLREKLSLIKGYFYLESSHRSYRIWYYSCFKERMFGIFMRTTSNFSGILTTFFSWHHHP